MIGKTKTKHIPTFGTCWVLISDLACRWKKYPLIKESETNWMIKTTGVIGLNNWVRQAALPPRTAWCCLSVYSLLIEITHHMSKFYIAHPRAIYNTHAKLEADEMNSRYAVHRQITSVASTETHYKLNLWKLSPVILPYKRPHKKAWYYMVT